jgi:branched-chain amino acid transport system permease protein
MMLSLLQYGLFFLTLALIYGTICLGLNLQWGFAGLFNVGVAGFVGVGAYACALVTAAPSPQHAGGFGLPIPLGWMCGMAAAALCSAVVGAATLRLRADYLAIATFGAAASLQLVMLNAQSFTGGPFGIALIPRPFGALAPAPLAFAAANLLLVAAVAGAAFIALERLTSSPWGRVLRALREDEAAAVSLGKSPARYRMQAFVLGGALMGLGGAMQAQFFGFIAPDNYLPALTFLIWVMLVLGGSGRNRGAIAGAVVVWALWTLSGTLLASLLPNDLQARGASLRLVLIGVVLAATLVLRPRGLFGERAAVVTRAAGPPWT